MEDLVARTDYAQTSQRVVSKNVVLERQTGSVALNCSHLGGRSGVVFEAESPDDGVVGIVDV